MSTTPEAPTDRIRVDTLPYKFIADIQQQFRDKLYNPTQNPYATDELTELRCSWDEDSLTTVYTTGLFDLLHMDHAGYLLHTKAAGAAKHFETNVEEGAWVHLSVDEQMRYTEQALGSGAVQLIVSVDGDRSASAKKSGKPEKGGGPRPIYSWETRALMVAGLSYVNPTSTTNELLPIADAVTIHGAHDFPDAQHPHHNHFTLAEALLPNTWAFFGESADIIELAPQIPALGNVALHCIQDGAGTHYFEDGFIGKMSTTNIVKRITGN